MTRLVFFLTGLAMVLAAAALAADAAAFLREASLAPGRVAYLRAGSHHPQVVFVLPDGGRISYPQNGWVGGYRPGDRVAVRYRRHDPAGTGRVATFGATWGIALSVGLAGLVFAAAGLDRRGRWTRA